MPVYLPPKAKSQRSLRESRLSTAQGAQSGSDTERATGKVVHIRSSYHAPCTNIRTSIVWNALLRVLLCKEAMHIHPLLRGTEPITIYRQAHEMT